MSQKSIKKNYLYNLIYQILLMIIPLITTPYLSRTLGVENIGIYSYTLSIATYFILFGSLGLSLYGQREIAYTQNDITGRSKVFYEIIIIRFITLTASTILFYCAFCIDGQYSMYYKILICEVLANMFDISWFFQGLEDFKKTIIRNGLVKLISIILVFMLVKEPSDLYRYFIIYVLSTLIGNLSLWIYIPKYIVKIRLNEIHINKHIKPTLALFIPQIATQVYTVLDKTMIGTIISDKSEVGYYEQAQKIIKLLITAITSLGTVMMPRIAATYANGDREKIKKYMVKSFAFVLMLAFPIMFGIVSVANKFVPLFFGNGYEKVATLICIISPIVLFIGLSNVLGVQYLLATKQQKKFTISVVMGAVVNFILNMMLIHSYKSIGASIATVVAEFIVLLVQFVITRGIISIKLVFKKSIRYMIASICMFLVSYGIGLVIRDNQLSIALQVLASILVYLIILMVMKDELLNDIIVALRDKMHYRRNKI